MSRSFFASALAALVLLLCAGLASAQQSGTAAEARAMLDRAVAALKTEFKSTALREFNDKNNKQYHDRDLYVFCNNMPDGKTTAHALAAPCPGRARGVPFIVAQSSASRFGACTP